MTLTTYSDAIFHETIEWHGINWSAVNRNVRRLQVRIVKAVKAGKWRLVKNLQRLLAHSLSGRCLAVRRVTENKGKRTSGIDKDVWDTPEKKMKAVYDLSRTNYRPKPLRRIYIPKSNGKKRPLGIPTMKDRACQALHLLGLDPISETQADRNSYGFRRDRSTMDANAQCYLVLCRKTSAKWVLEGDIKSCFDKISHDWLLDNIPTDKKVLKKWLKAGYMEKEVFNLTEEGTPQGGIISPVIANMALDGMEGVISKIGRYQKVNFVRYADDFIITGNSKELLEEKIKPQLVKFLQERGLTLSEEKTRITHIDEGFDFLGQNIRKYNGTLITKPSKKNVETFLGKIREKIKTNAQAKTGNLIGMLNLKIRGWANYHRYAASSRTFGKVDHEIFTSLWQWAKRRHPTKSTSWIKNRYFKSTEEGNWTFQGITDEGMVLRLFKAQSVLIKKYVKIKGAANPYDPEYERYFEERTTKKWKANSKWKKIKALYTRQIGICPICKQQITEESEYHVHHRIPRCEGGADTLNNLVLLHPNCHRQVHTLNLNVSKLANAKRL